MSEEEVKPGDRIGAILSIDPKSEEVVVLGYGRFRGEKDGIPMLQLYSGQAVSGFECAYWGPAKEIRAALKGRNVSMARIQCNEAGEISSAELSQGIVLDLRDIDLDLN